MIAYLVESDAIDQNGVRRGGFRLCTPSKERAIALCAEAPDRRWREATDEELRPAEIENLRRSGFGVKE